jgi:hypothetical protein
MKFCKDCKWYQSETWTLPSLYPLTYKLHDEHCSNPKTSCKRADVVRGEVSDFAFKCKLDPRGLRGTLAACGPTAKWFEEKEKPISKCTDCKWLECTTCYYAVPDELTGLAKLLDHAENIRLDESKCGKYGKWWEKKVESFPISYIEYTTKAAERLAALPPKQSWLCRLICGHHGRLNDKR